MAKLNQIIAIEKGIKSKNHSFLSELYKLVQKPELFNGLTKNYEKKDEAGEDLPAERKKVQYTVPEVLDNMRNSLSELMTVTARKDYTNCVAKADVVIDGKTLVPDAPVSFLLFLEKVLSDSRAFIDALPILDQSEDWKMDEAANLWKTNPLRTHRTKKVQEPIVLFPATEEHPAQTQLITVDIIAGHWNQIKMSGSIPIKQKQMMLERVDTMLKAVKEARESANIQDEVSTPDVGKAIFQYLFKGE